METTAPAIDLSNVKYRIGKSDIAKGCRRRADNCPNTLAVLRWLAKHYPGTDFVAETDRANVRVMTVKSWRTRSDGTIWTDLDGHRHAAGYTSMWQAESPTNLRYWVDTFDNDDGPVAPIEVNLHFGRLDFI